MYIQSINCSIVPYANLLQHCNKMVALSKLFKCIHRQIELFASYFHLLNLFFVTSMIMIAGDERHLMESKTGVCVIKSPRSRHEVQLSKVNVLPACRPDTT